jgi:hypothetical protein
MMSIFHLYVTTPKQHQHMEYISLSHIPEHVVPINFLDIGLHGQQKNDKRTNNDLQNIHMKLKIE